MSAVAELLKFIPVALGLVADLRAGRREKALNKARILAETLDIKVTTRAVAKATRR